LSYTPDVKTSLIIFRQAAGTFRREAHVKNLNNRNFPVNGPGNGAIAFTVG